MDEESFKDNIGNNESPLDVRIVGDTVKRKGDTIRTVLTLISLVIACLSLWLSKKSIDRSIESGAKTKEYVDIIDSGIIKMNAQFKEVGEEIKNLPQSVEKLDTVMLSMGEQIEGLKSGIVSFRSTMDEINSVADTSLSLLKQWEKELSRQPDLRVACNEIMRDSANTLTVKLIISNFGLRTVEHIELSIIVANNYQFNAPNWKKATSLDGIETWTCDVNSFFAPRVEGSSEIISSSSDKLLSFTIKIPNNFKGKVIRLSYRISHSFAQKGNLVVAIPAPGSSISNIIN